MRPTGATGASLVAATCTVIVRQGGGAADPVQHAVGGADDEVHEAVIVHVHRRRPGAVAHVDAGEGVGAAGQLDEGGDRRLVPAVPVPGVPLKVRSVPFASPTTMSTAPSPSTSRKAPAGTPEAVKLRIGHHQVDARWRCDVDVGQADIDAGTLGEAQAVEVERVEAVRRAAPSQGRSPSARRRRGRAAPASRRHTGRTSALRACSPVPRHGRHRPVRGRSAARRCWRPPVGDAVAVHVAPRRRAVGRARAQGDAVEQRRGRLVHERGAARASSHPPRS